MAVNTDEPIGYKEITVTYHEYGEYQYFASFALSFGYRGLKTTTADDTGVTLARLWADGELIYDIATGKVASGVKWYIRHGTEDQDPIPGWNLAYRGHLLICFVDYPLGDSASIPTISAEFIDTVSYSVADIMETFAVLAGYDISDVATENLDDLSVLGYLLDGQSTLEGVATSLGFLYDFSMAENAGVVTFARKYEAGALVIDFTVPDGFLAVLQEGSKDGRISVMERSADQSLPAKISAQYFEVASNYDTGNQSVQRNGGPIKTHSSSSDISISVPIVAAGDDIRSLLYDALTKAWQERNGHSLRLPRRYLAANPGDTVQWTNFGGTYTGQLVKTTLNADNTISASLIEKDAEYTPNVLDTQPPATPVAHVGFEPLTVAVFDVEDTDEDQTVDNYVNIRFAIGGTEPDAFYGARLQMAKLEPLPTWSTALELTKADEVMVATLVDLDTDITIQLGNMTYARLLDGVGENLVIGAGSTAEIITYSSVTPGVSPDQYVLGGLTRGLFGTDLFTNVHVADEHAAFFDDMPVVRIQVLDYMAGQKFLYRTIPDGMQPYEAENRILVPAGNSRRPYSPDNAAASRDIGGDWTITWDEDDRFTGEPDSRFSLDFYNEDWTAVVRRINLLDTSVTGNTFTYYIEEQMIDGVNELDSVNVLIYQINASHVGRGFPGGGTLGVIEPVELEGTIDANPTFEADLQLTVALAGAINANPTFTANLSINGVELAGTIEADPTFEADLEVGVGLVGTIDASPTFEADLLVSAPPATQVTFVAMGASHDGDGTVAFPAGIQAGDFLMVLVENAAQTVSISSGWSADYSIGNGNSITQLQVFTKFYSPGDTAPTISGTANHNIAIMAAFRGVNTGAPYDNAWEANSTTATAAGVFPAIDSTGTGRLAVFVGTYSVAGVVSITITTGKSYSTPSFTSLGLVATTSTGDSGHIGFAYGGLPTAVSHASPSASMSRSGGGTTGNITATCILKV